MREISRFKASRLLQFPVIGIYFIFVLIKFPIVLMREVGKVNLSRKIGMPRVANTL